MYSARRQAPGDGHELAGRGFGGMPTGFKPRSTTYELESLGLTFLLCKTGIIIKPAHQDFFKDQVR